MKLSGLTHVHGAIESHHGAEGGEKTNHEASALGAPAAAVGDVEESDSGTVLGCHGQNWDDDGEEAYHVEDQDEPFGYRECLGQKDINGYCDNNSRDDE